MTMLGLAPCKTSGSSGVSGWRVISASRLAGTAFTCLTRVCASEGVEVKVEVEEGDDDDVVEEACLCGKRAASVCLAGTPWA